MNKVINLQSLDYLQSFEKSEPWDKNALTNYDSTVSSVVIDWGVGNTIVITGFNESPMENSMCGALVTHFADSNLDDSGVGTAKVMLVLDEQSFANACSYIRSVVK
tara:strand:- start:580 stop:897 length:318 start_codon:yes stop_codon:yes gene_type:complete